GVTLASAAFGQSTTPSGPQLYRVEIIVFAHRQGNPAEEDFAYIARREAMNGGPAPGAIDVFDFGPYVPDDVLSDDLDAEQRDPRSRLLLGQDAETRPEREEVARTDPANDSP